MNVLHVAGAIEFEEADLSALSETSVSNDNELVMIDKPRKELPGTRFIDHPHVIVGNQINNNL